MTVYADVLILLNAVIDYLIISLTSHITDTYIKTFRVVVAAFVGSLFSLLIFLPEMFALLQLIILLLSSALIVFVAFGIKNKKSYIKNFFAYAMVNVIFSGLMVLFWILVKPRGMILNNSFVYFQISPLEFIISSCVFYVIIRLVQSILKKRERYAKRCNIKLDNNGKTVYIKTIVDTGNSLTDPYSNRPVIITDKDTAEMIFDNLEEQPKLLLPVHSVIGEGLIPAYSLKNATVENIRVTSVLIAVTDKKFDGDYSGIVSPEILN
ncbi:MAG: sigma-E processing peptidase SpoIIGA [Acutalibacteraceae bacterium]|nr:sigma-E processing peptidase SpoIIGA [Acutalibacteraceae bacterium]